MIASYLQGTVISDFILNVLRGVILSLVGKIFIFSCFIDKETETCKVARTITYWVYDPSRWATELLL